MNGGFSPLEGFMNEKDYTSCVARSLATVWRHLPRDIADIVGFVIPCD